MKQQIIELIKQEKVIGIVRGVDAEHIIPTAEALYKGGIRMIEITFDQRNPEHLTETQKLIQMVSEQLEGKICVGAGTVMNIAQCEAAFKAGAKYFISPNVNAEVIKKANELDVVSIPGALSPSEAAYAYDQGADFVKLFPAGDLGSAYIKSLCAPLNHIPFLAVGGISPENMKEFMSTGIYGVGVGGKLIDKKVIYSGEYDKITKVAQEYVEVK
ncbi:bifunctional 4-hydroxy-2-oxoglutarate aldolase/2-dehydro-3-deoxy-phosphogluconate aldolase [Faecalicatena contorta]|uniref:bifunctional 4-hydroxy-2-oxoglutarate aldolase/2-dehydro-3-deoxy-phosphogluconate aldolase n=1 Tax=Faecalicatena contorta TaxID=39482 RepID=UPI00129D88A0|nr:bifunctional 4-hydroxy-2-oxoglutarate aldolase/2-dehydro-3-deoxy-phosphogluconate aldolase [Faecalicatena contorta]MRM88986.1 bifunctional 4-hydroxy-2-oxoglutarate aldolase/2-dehydro-3-deoxy-phosphogluconate aldolase [Faecalicatena contorta]